MEPWGKEKKREIVGYTYIHIYTRYIYIYKRKKKREMQEIEQLYLFVREYQILLKHRVGCT